MSGPSDLKGVSLNGNVDRSPDRCFLQDRPELPRIEVPYDSKEGFENALLVTNNTMQDLIENIVNSSATLKAWFALKLPYVGQSGESVKKSIVPQWGPVWTLIKKQKGTWDGLYVENAQSARRWEIRKPTSVGELYAHAMFVLYRKTQNNKEHDDTRQVRLKWHKYYHSDERKFFLLYNLLVFLDSYCTGQSGTSAIKFERPIKDEKLAAWSKTRGSRIHSAAQRFQISKYIICAPLIALISTLLTDVDNIWSTSTLHGYEAYFKPKIGKEVGIISNEGTASCRVFKQLAEALLQGAQDYFTQGVGCTLGEVLRSSLGWPSDVTITRVSLRGLRGDDHQKLPVDKIECVLKYIREDKAPWIWLETSTEPQQTLKQNDQVDYTRHSILQLEKWVNTLTKPDATYAASLFTLLRRNHRRSRDFVEDLTALFAPFRQLNDANSERSRSLLEIFDGQSEASSHASHLSKIESLASDLKGTSAEDARAVLYLIRRGFRTCRDSMDELKVIFGPLHQRNAEELKYAVAIKKVFEAIDKEAENLDVG
jgi:hypothetical protein